MIKLINSINQTCGFDDVFAVKIRSSVMAYGFDKPFLLTWVQTVGDRSTALIQKQDNGVTVSCCDGDFDELNEFLDVIGYESAFMSAKTAERLNIAPSLIGAVMEYNGNGIFGSCKRVDAPDYKSIYTLLCHCGFDMLDFEAFYLDLSHRVRHSTARVFANNDYSAVAFTAWETENDAVISAVAVAENMRLKGVGSDALQSLISELKAENKRIFLYRKLQENEEFYIKNGMINCGEFAVL